MKENNVVTSETKDALSFRSLSSTKEMNNQQTQWHLLNIFCD